MVHAFRSMPAPAHGRGGGVEIVHHSGDLPVAIEATTAQGMLPPQERNQPERIAVALARLVQRELDGHHANDPGGRARALTDPEFADDPLMQSDPAQPWAFWANADFDPVLTHGGTPVWLVSRSLKISVIWDSAESQYVTRWISTRRSGATI